MGEQNNFSPDKKINGQKLNKIQEAYKYKRLKKAGFFSYDSKTQRENIISDISADTIKIQKKLQENKSKPKERADRNLYQSSDKNFSEVIKKFNGDTYVGISKGNGNRPFGIMVPRDFDESLPTEIIVSFHGTSGELIKKPIEKKDGMSEFYLNKVGQMSVAENRLNQIITRGNQMQKSKKNFIIIYPLSAGQRVKQSKQLDAYRKKKDFESYEKLNSDLSKNSPAYRNCYDSLWMDPKNTDDNFGLMIEEAKIVLKKHFHHSPKKYSVTIKGHSAGGLALSNVSKYYPVDRIDFMDASYGTWANDTYNNAKKLNPNVNLNLYIRKGSNTDKNSKNLANQKGVTINYSNIDHGDFISNFF